ncbi:MAG: phosphopantetheine-binding protein [Kouleothrix sp.]
MRLAVAMVREETPGDRRLVDMSAGRQASRTPAWPNCCGHTRTPARLHAAERDRAAGEPCHTHNGKLDTRALPAPGAGRHAVGPPPRHLSRRTVAAIWVDVLHVEAVGAQDNFFELGGHSLLATLVVSRLRETLQIEVPLSVLMSVSPTVAGPARALEEHRDPPGRASGRAARHDRAAFRSRGGGGAGSCVAPGPAGRSSPTHALRSARLRPAETD